MYDVCLICGCIYDTRAPVDHYAWHATRGEFPPNTDEEAPDGNVGP